jgi:hypothetical protein
MIVTNITLKLDTYGDKNGNDYEAKELSIGLIFDSDPFELKIDTTLEDLKKYFNIKIFIPFIFLTLILPLCISFLILWLCKCYNCLLIKYWEVDDSLQYSYQKLVKLY